jgi:hypothetical protein
MLLYFFHEFRLSFAAGTHLGGVAAALFDGSDGRDGAPLISDGINGR